MLCILTPRWLYKCITFDLIVPLIAIWVQKMCIKCVKLVIVCHWTKLISTLEGSLNRRNLCWFHRSWSRKKCGLFICKIHVSCVHILLQLSLHVLCYSYINVTRWCQCKYSLSSVFSPIIRLTMWQGTGNKWNKHCVELERNGFFHWDEMEHISKSKPQFLSHKVGNWQPWTYTHTCIYVIWLSTPKY